MKSTIRTTYSVLYGEQQVTDQAKWHGLILINPSIPYLILVGREVPFFNLSSQLRQQTSRASMLGNGQ
jgi:hypothetical protein